MITILFWFSAAVLAYVYFGYPMIVRSLAALIGRPVGRAVNRPRTLTVVITAYNEERSILGKLDNIFALEYPRELLDVIVASDGSSDRTDELVSSCGRERAQLLRVEGRRGKTACQNLAAQRAAGEILVFTDATTLLEPNALAVIAENFVDPQVGCVAGLLIYRRKGENLTAGGGVSYWNYEVALRMAESRLRTLIGVSGCLYAVRRSAYRPIPPHLISDFVIAMRMREQGLRTVLDTRAICFEDTLDRSRHELAMRVRVTVRTISALVAERRFLNPFVDPLFAWQLWSHKLLRYASPYWLLLMLLASAALARAPLYRVALLGEVAVLATGLAGFALQMSTRRVGWLGKPYYFLLTNLASVIAMLRYAMGERMVTWNPLR